MMSFGLHSYDTYSLIFFFDAFITKWFGGIFCKSLYCEIPGSILGPSILFHYICLVLITEGALCHFALLDCLQSFFFLI